MNATFVDGELEEENYQEKHQIVDVVLRLNDKTQVVLEMNRRFQNWLFNRNLSYIYSINNKENRVGKKYSADNLVIQINFDAFKNKNGWPKLINIFVKKELTVDYAYPYENEIVVHVPIEYSKNILYTKDVNKDFINCLKLICAETKEEMEQVSKDNKVLKEVLTSMKEYSSNDEMAIYYDDELQAEMIRNSEIEEATNKGVKLGEARGRLDEKQEIAKTMLQEGNLSLEQISKYTSIPLAELEKLKSSI